jgi:hypothetical protein
MSVSRWKNNKFKTRIPRECSHRLYQMLKEFPRLIEQVEAVNEVGAAFHLDLCHVGSPIAMRAISLPLSSITQTTQPL